MANGLVASDWQPRGSRPATEGQVEGIDDQEVVGAVRAIAAHPEDADILYLGAVNGGIWRSRNATADSPSWENLRDEAESLSIGGLDLDPTDATRQTIVAGTGRFSSNARAGGVLIGVMRSTDGGATWTDDDAGGLLRSVHITAIAARGETIIVASASGLFRTADGGANWGLVSDDPASGLPPGGAFDLAGDPANPQRLFTHAGSAGLFRSDDTGATWTRLANQGIDNTLQFSTRNVRISVGRHDNVYVAIANGRQLAGLFRSGDGGTSWRALDLPITREGGNQPIGIHPGGQAGIHLSLAADPGHENLVYIGGDRQPWFDEAQPPSLQVRVFPNSIGARDFSGRLFRVDASRPSGSQATHITHSNTAGGTSPHADSRDMAFSANGELLEADDGGIYRRTQPHLDSGDWLSMNGDLQTSEYHSVAWDANTGTVIGGAQDTGTQQQLHAGDTRWPSVTVADGGVVATGITSPGISVRYSSFQELGDFTRQTFDSTGRLLNQTQPRLRSVVPGQDLSPSFYTPLQLNAVAPRRMVLGAANGTYESFDQCDTVRRISPRIVNDPGPIAYGVPSNEDLLLIGAGTQVLARTGPHPTPLRVLPAYPGFREVVGIALDPADPDRIFVVDLTTVRRTVDGGATWDDITNDLTQAGARIFRSIAFCDNLGAGALAVGSNTGVFAADGPDFATWEKLGGKLPSAPVFGLQYSAADEILLAGTLGRGAWTLDLSAPSPPVP